MVGGDHAVELAAAAADAGSSRPRWPPAARSSSSPPSTRRSPRSSSPRLVGEAGFPAGVFNVITGSGRATSGAALVGHPGVDKVAFTGSTATGIDVAEAAAEHLAQVTLELGGKSPQIVFPDADLDAAANGVIAGVFAATGQTCMAGSRLIVHDDVHDELVERVAARARAIMLGDPTRAGRPRWGRSPTRRSTRRSLGFLRRPRASRARPSRLRRRPRRTLGGFFVKPTRAHGRQPATRRSCARRSSARCSPR